MYVLQCHMQKTRIKTLPDTAYSYPFPHKLSSSIFGFVDTCATRKQLSSPPPPVRSRVHVMTPTTLRTRAAYRIRDGSRWAPKRKRTAAPAHPWGAVGANAQYHTKIKSISVSYHLCLAYQPLKGLLTQALSMRKPKSDWWWWLRFLIWARRRIWLVTGKLFQWTDSKILF